MVDRKHHRLAQPERHHLHSRLCPRALLHQLGPELSAEPFMVPAWEGMRAFTPLPGVPLFPRLDDDKRKALLEKWRPHQEPDAKAPAQTQTQAQAPASAPGDGKRLRFEDFAGVELRVGQVVVAEAVPKAKKLLRLEVDLGPHGRRQIVSGIAERYQPEALVGKRIVVLCNLEPATIRGVRSEGMLLAAGDEADTGISGLATIDGDAPLGARVR